MAQTKIGWRPYVSGTDADAQAFITAAAITDSTQQSAINTLVTQLKTYGIWTKMKALYPMVGGTATSHKFNLKDPRDLDAAFRLVFNGGWTHTSTGAKPNGTNGWATTYFNGWTNLTNPLTSNHLSIYLRTNIDEPVWDIGSAIDPGYQYTMTIRASNVIYAGNGVRAVFVSNTNTDSRGLFINSRTGLNTHKLLINGVLTATNTNTCELIPSTNIALATRYNVSTSTPQSYSSKEQAFASIGDGLTDAEAANFYTAVQTYQSTLGRNVGAPIVADADAQAFLNAAAITDLGQANAVNTLVTDLKAANIWTKMKALYPMVGGTVTSHKFNLKDPRDVDAAYRLAFNGGWTHTSTGAKPNGTNGYADTFLTPSTSLQQNSVHISYYSRTNMSHYGIDFGVYAITPQSCLYGVIKDTDGKCYFRLNRNASIPESSQAMTSASIFFMLNRVAGYSGESLFVNNTKTSFGQTSTGLSNYKIPLGALSNAGTYQSYSIRESAFASIGDGLSDVEATAFYTAIQKYQTSLGRQV